jgi:hypothetical protein
VTNSNLLGLAAAHLPKVESKRTTTNCCLGSGQAADIEVGVDAMAEGRASELVGWSPIEISSSSKRVRDSGQPRLARLMSADLRARRTGKSNQG